MTMAHGLRHMPLHFGSLFAYKAIPRTLKWGYHGSVRIMWDLPGKLRDLVSMKAGQKSGSTFITLKGEKRICYEIKRRMNS